jgi:hypothetical protein
VPGSAFEWRDVIVPSVIFRAPQGDGLEIHVSSRTVPETDYQGQGFAMGRVVTIAEGIQQNHENVLMGTTDPWVLANLLGDAASKSTIDRTISLFDDGMTIRIERFVDEMWSVTCRPISLPPPDADWKTFPEFTFVVNRTSLERARREAGVLGARLRDEPLGS